MTKEILASVFTNGISQVRVSGGFNYWGDGELMTNNPGLLGDAKNIYTAIISFLGDSGGCHQYKFRENGGWENPPSMAGNPNNNRVLFVPAGSQILPLVFYNE
jgi:hypothetical protein